LRRTFASSTKRDDPHHRGCGTHHLAAFEAAVTDYLWTRFRGLPASFSASDSTSCQTGLDLSLQFIKNAKNNDTSRQRCARRWTHRGDLPLVRFGLAVFEDYQRKPITGRGRF
jgi:hypothetical protein